MSPNFIRRMLLTLVILVGLWGGFALMRHVRQDNAVALALPKVDTSKVDAVELYRKPDSTKLVRGATGVWTVNGLPASKDVVTTLLQGLADTATSTDLVAQNKSSHERLGVDDAQGQRVRVLAKGVPVLELIAGKQDNAGGVMVRRPGDDAVYALKGALAGSLSHSLDDWRDKIIVRAEPDSIGSVDVTHGKPYLLKRVDKGWLFGTGAPADSSAVANLLGNYREILSSGFPTLTREDSSHFKTAKGHLKIVSKSGKEIASLVVDSSSAGIWVRADTGGVVYKIEPYTWNQIAPAESTLKAKKKG